MGMLNRPVHSWKLDPASDKQKGLLLKRGLITIEQLDTLTKGQASELIDKLKKAEPEPELASEAQISLIKKLAAKLGNPAPADNLTKRQAFNLIRELKAQDENLWSQIEEGIYQYEGDIYRIKRYNAYQRVVSKLVALDEPEEVSNGVRTHKFLKVSSTIIRKFTPDHRLTREQAVQFASETSTCVRCGIRLEPTITQADGSPRFIGPVCETKMGWR